MADYAVDFLISVYPSLAERDPSKVIEFKKGYLEFASAISEEQDKVMDRKIIFFIIKNSKNCLK